MIANVLQSTSKSLFTSQNKKFVTFCLQGFYLFFGVFFRGVGGVFPERLKFKGFHKRRRYGKGLKKRCWGAPFCLFVEIFLLKFIQNMNLLVTQLN